MSTVVQEIEALWGDAQSDVVALMAAFVKGEQVAISAISKAQNWLAVNLPSILSDAEAAAAAATPLIGILDPALMPTVNEAIAALQAFVASEEAATQTVPAVASGMSAVAAVQVATQAITAAVAAAAQAKKAA